MTINEVQMFLLTDVMFFDRINTAVNTTPVSQLANIFADFFFANLTIIQCPASDSQRIHFDILDVCQCNLFF